MSFKNNPFDKSSMNNICYFVPKYLKETFEKSQNWSGYEEFIGYGPIGPIFWP